MSASPLTWKDGKKIEEHGMPPHHLYLKYRGGEVAIVATLQPSVRFWLLLGGLHWHWEGQGFEGRERYWAVLKMEPTEVQ